MILIIHSTISEIIKKAKSIIKSNKKEIKFTLPNHTNLFIKIIVPYQRTRVKK